jgi:hypothetical protein
VNNFICDMCGLNQPQSMQWEEMCVYCNENCLLANLEMLRNQIKDIEMSVA